MTAKNGKPIKRMLSFDEQFHVHNLFTLYENYTVAVKILVQMKKKPLHLLDEFQVSLLHCINQK